MLFKYTCAVHTILTQHHEVAGASTSPTSTWWRSTPAQENGPIVPHLHKQSLAPTTPPLLPIYFHPSVTHPHINIRSMMSSHLAVHYTPFHATRPSLYASTYAYHMYPLYFDGIVEAPS